MNGKYYNLVYIAAHSITTTGIRCSCSGWQRPRSPISVIIAWRPTLGIMGEQHWTLQVKHYIVHCVCRLAGFQWSRRKLSEGWPRGRWHRRTLVLGNVSFLQEKVMETWLFPAIIDKTLQFNSIGMVCWCYQTDNHNDFFFWDQTIYQFVCSGKFQLLTIIFVTQYNIYKSSWNVFIWMLISISMPFSPVASNIIIMFELWRQS